MTGFSDRPREGAITPKRRTRIWAGLLLVAAALVVAGVAGALGHGSPERAADADHPGEVDRSAPRAASGTRSERGETREAGGPERGIKPEVKHDTSPPLRSLKAKPRHQGKRLHEEPALPVPKGSGSDPVVQTSSPAAGAPTAGANFEGIQAQDSIPPDPNGAAGPNAYVQIVNEEFEVFTKTGAPLYGPVPTNTLWTGFGGGCETNDDGDATVVYDHLAGRWVIQQFSVSSTPYLDCIAVSTTGDPTGSYYRYAFGGFGSEFPDYPKLGVWPDAYYVTYNLFQNGQSFDGPEACAYDRAKMLTGAPAAQQCEPVADTGLGGMLPSDVDGPTPPPAGSPNFLLSFGTGTLELWKFHVDWSNPANTTFTGPTSIPVASFTPACGGGACIPQKGTSQVLDSLGDRLMYRLAYRNFGDHESLVVTHSVKAGSTVGVRWYELRDPNGTPTVYQQGTYAPADGKYRWMSSAAMDASGDIALGFSTSSGSVFPGIAYTGRLAGDPLGTMTQGETVLKAGVGSQTTYERWGDYSSMSIDPSDDCTFWYTNEYLPTTDVFNWHTRIGSFSLPGCAAGASDNFSIAATPTSVTVPQGGSGSTSIGTTVTSGSSQTVAFSASGLPFDATASFSPSSVAAGDASTLTFEVGSDTPAGTYAISVVGTGTSAIQTTTVSLTVTPQDAVTNGGFESGLSGWTTGGGFTPLLVSGKGKVHSGTQAVQLGSTTRFAGDSTLSQLVTVPAGSSQLSFWYAPRCRVRVATDQIQAQLQTTGGATLATILNVCKNTSGWQHVTFDTSAYAGQSLVLWFNAHASGSAKTNYFYLDDVSLTTAATSPVQNGGFETGDLTSWTASGVQAPAMAAGHSGHFGVRLGSPTAFDGDSTLTQTVIVPGTNPKLTLWYQPHCNDTIDFDQIQVQIRNDSGQVRSTPLNVCSRTGKWTQATFGLGAFAGQAVVLALNVHDDGVAADPTWALLDDVSIG